MKRTHTLRSIAAEMNREKRTVQLWYQRAKEQSQGEIGELRERENTRYFSDEERELLISFGGGERVSSSAKTATPPSVTVEVGNHQILLNAPQLPQSYTLEGLRTTEAVSIADPLAVAAQFLQAADLVIDGMNQDLKQRQHQLEQTRKAKDAIAAKKQQLELEARLYQMQTSGLDAAVTRTTQTLQDDLTALQRMGKPTSGDTATPC